jgi:hypothetical protein
MARRRLTTRRLVASPDAFSGRNFNSPVMLYDTHPNRHFIVGEDVMPVTGGGIRGTPVRMTVLGHCAEDRLWLKGPYEIEQWDVSDVIPMRDYEYGEAHQAKLKGPQASRSAARGVRADFLELEDEGSGDDETEEVQELIFDSLPEDQDPEEGIDTEPEDSGEVTLIDLGSVCDDKYDQTEAIEQVLQDSGSESWEGEEGHPF